MRSFLRRALALAVPPVLALGLITPGWAAAPGPARSRPGSPALVQATTGASGYGNPYNDYRRSPYGVMQTPQEQQSLPPVKDDPKEPFDWYRYPRAAIGVYGGPERSIITPEGYLQNEYGALTFATGDSRTPVNQRVKTWVDGYLPIMSEQFDSGGVQHAIRFFAAKVPNVAKLPFTQPYGLPAKKVTADVDNMVNFVKVSLTNPGSSPVTHRFSATLDLTKGIGAINGNTGPSKPASPGWDDDHRVYGGDGKLLLVSGQAPSGTDGATQDYDVTLQPHQTRTLTFAMPYFVGQDSDTAPIKGADYDGYEQQTAQFWHKTLDQAGTVLQVPGSGAETKVLDAYKANLAFSLILMNVIDGRYYWNANPTIYAHYWLRDTAFDIDGILNAGFTDVAKQVTLEMLDWQSDSGQFISQSGQYDGNGEALWAFANYYERTHDTEFARQVWPAVQRAMDWEWQVRRQYWQSDDGLFPASTMKDDEGVRGHVLTYDLWNIAGEEGAAKIAEAVGDGATATTWKQRRTQYIGILRSKLAPQVKKLGVIPPTTEGMAAPGVRDGWYGGVYGIDWGNLEAVWPANAFRPNDPWITKSLATWRGKTFEGIFGYPSGGVESTLHSYTPMSLSITDILRGDQDAALSSLYSLLTHTSAAHMASEGMASAQRWGWSSTDQTQPHAEFAGKYLTFLRDMLAYEASDGSLHLANVWSPQWNKPGQTVGFSGDTDFGPMSYTAAVDGKGATMRLTPPTRGTPKNLVISAPDGTVLTSVTVDGRHTGGISGKQVTLTSPGKASVIRLNWTRTRSVPQLGVARAAADYEANYQRMTSPTDAAVTAVKSDHRVIEAGAPLTVTGTVVNNGGAGYLADPRVVLYVNGQATQTDTTTFARGIGFTTPARIVSFGHHDEGTVSAVFSPQLCAPGHYTIGIGLGSAAPTHTVEVDVRAPSKSTPPTATLELSPGSPYVDGGGKATVTGKVTNTGCLAVTGTKVTLATPDGWTATPQDPAELGTIEPGASATASWTLTPPATLPDPDTTVNVGASATFTDGPGGTGKANGSTTFTAFAAPSADYRTVAGTATHVGQLGDRFAVFADGKDQWGRTDQFGALYRKGAGKEAMTVTTKVTRQDPTGVWAKAGIVVRNDLSAKSPGYVILAATPANGVVMQWDANGDGYLDTTLNTGFSGYPVQLKLVRSGATFTGSFSLDGKTWQQVATAQVPSAAATQDVGLSSAAVTGDTSGKISGAEFTGFGIE
ncbi:NEW3 domain-containing protein [Actinoallomurus sp. CA-150999]|uniref:NEW3 domain-containing protein n=1 Tax=Actinoallomurus sp. CA-150999 TaxID=3239887 RepID=UPI003D90C03F